MPSSFCHLCGQPINRGSKLYHHPSWPAGQRLRVCADCQAKKPRCKVCGLPMASQLPGGTCSACTDTRGVCRACGKPIRKSGGAVVYPGAGSYCPACARSRPPCDVCGGPLTDERWLLSDGRVSCAHCHATGVYTPAAANALYKHVQSTAQGLGLTLNIPTGLALVDRIQLAEIIRQQVADAPSSDALDPDKTLGLYARRGLKRGIYVQSGLPRNLLYQITAHEFGHAWQGENCPLLKDPLVREGFAEWLAFTLLGQSGLTQQQRLMAARTDLYGDGLRWAQQIVAAHGLPGLLAACRQNS